MKTIPQNPELLNQLRHLLWAHRHLFKQTRIFHQVVALVLAEIMVFTRHTITQMLFSMGRVDEDWSRWYRLFNRQRFPYQETCEVLFKESLTHVGEDELYVAAGDSTQTRRSSRKLEGAHWLHNPQSPVFKRGIHIAQRWFNGSWLLPAENGYSRAVPLWWQPAFTEKSRPTTVAPCKEWEAALQFLVWLRQMLTQAGRARQRILMVGDGHYDTLNLWKHLPDGVILCARSAKNRVLYHLPPAGSRPNRRYGDRAPTPREQWGQRKGWRNMTLQVRQKPRHLQVKVLGPFLRKGAPHRPLMLILVRGKNNTKTRRQPLPFLVNAVQDQGQWQLPLSVETLLFWSWQRWEVEVAHRELKSNFGLGNKQCFEPHAAVLSVQWSAWVYSLLLLSAYRTWGLSHAPPVPTRWWRGSGRWSLNTAWRGFRASLWGEHTFTPIDPEQWLTRPFLPPDSASLRHCAFASARS